jgi:hypothetical protein
MSKNLQRIKGEILEALGHIEAEDGLYFNNLIVVHEDEERVVVSGEEREVLQALNDLAKEGRIEIEGEGETAIFKKI